MKRIHPQTWEAIHRVLIRFARDEGIERGETIRGDTTVVDANIHEPADSSLLWDAVRVATRFMHRLVRRKPSLREDFSDHSRRAKRRADAIKLQAAFSTRAAASRYTASARRIRSRYWRSRSPRRAETYVASSWR